MKCSYVDLIAKTTEIGSVGTPQGGNMSPMLSNIYLHELDLYVKQNLVDSSKESGKTSEPNPESKKIHNEISNRRQKLSPSYR